MRHATVREGLSSFVYTSSLALAALSLFVACVTVPDDQKWIRVGVTTKDEVTTQYGQPDWMIVSPDGDTVVYRKTAFGPSILRLEIPTIQAGPFGAATTSMHPIDPGLGAKDLNGKEKERLRKEIRIRYDDRGVVQELSSP